ncbi:MAG: cobalamin-binding protein [Proteobacteria bacterium]|nr:MAG: cobalamin-binding protein [Pseudomonadota bacterium]
MEIIRYHGLVLQTLLLICSMAIPAGVAADPVSIADASGRAVELAHPARRIVSLAPHVSELLFEIGANDLLIGAVEFSDYPPAAVEILRIGDYKNFDMESLLELKPDLVIGWWSGNRSQHIEQIRALGIPVYLSEPRRLDQIPTLMRDLGRLSGRRMQSDAVAERFERHLNRLRSQYADQKPVSVFFQAWDQPLMTLNGEHLVSDAIAICGGTNVFAHLSLLAPTVTVEAVLVADPMVIVTGGIGRARSEWLERWQRWPQLRAVKHGHLRRIDPDLLQRPTSRILQGLTQLCEILAQARASLSKSAPE